MPMISAEYGIPNKHEVRSWGEIKSGFTHFAEGDVGLAKITPCFENRKSTIFRQLTGGIGAGTTELHIVRPIFVVAEYMLIFLKCPHFIETGIPKMTGTAGQKRVPTEYFTNSPFPLPPLAEQHRIVAKVDELMALCDQLEAERNMREARRDRLVASSLNRISTASTPVHPSTGSGRTGVDAEKTSVRAELVEAHDTVRFHLNHLPRLTTRTEHIKQLRQTILNLAVRGRLVAQDPNDEPAGKLLKRIQAEKVRLEKIEIIHEDEQVFIVPDGWSWSRLGGISRKIHYGYTASANQLIQNVRLLRITDIQNNAVEWSSVPGCEIPERDVPQYKLEDGDILIARTGGTIGKTFLVNKIPVIAVFASYLIRVQGAKELFVRYLKLFMESPVYWKQLKDGTRGAGQPNVNGQTLGNMLVPLPPLAEQYRIVAKVDELMALCDQLETQLTITEADSRRLLEAVLRDALNPAIKKVA